MKSYELKPTANPELSRVVDRKGDWRWYYHHPSGKYLRAVNAILDEGYAKGKRFYEYLKNANPEEAERRLQAAGDRGDAIHQAINILIKARKAHRDEIEVLAEDNKTLRRLTDDEWDCLLAWGEFIKRHEAVITVSEWPTYNLRTGFKIQEGYAGTLDAIGVLYRCCGVKSCPCKEYIGRTGLWDWKSSGGIYASYGAQVAAYAACPATREKTEGLDYTAIIRVGTNHKTTGGYEFEPYDKKETEQHFVEFASALQIALAESKPFDPEKEVKEIPDVIDLNVKVEETKEETTNESDTGSNGENGGRSEARPRKAAGRRGAKGQARKSKGGATKHRAA